MQVNSYYGMVLALLLAIILSPTLLWIMSIIANTHVQSEPNIYIGTAPASQIVHLNTRLVKKMAIFSVTSLSKIPLNIFIGMVQEIQLALHLLQSELKDHQLSDNSVIILAHPLSFYTGMALVEVHVTSHIPKHLKEDEISVAIHA